MFSKCHQLESTPAPNRTKFGHDPQHPVTLHRVMILALAALLCL